MLPLLATLFGPGKPKTPSAFVTDTLAPILGQSIFTDERPGAFMAPLKNGVPLRAEALLPDTVRLYGSQPEQVLAHEAGHLLDGNHIAPEVVMRAVMQMSRYRHPSDYYGSDPTEYAAEAFARAVQSGRHGFADSTQTEQRFPGSLELIRWLRTRPPFKK